MFQIRMWAYPVLPLLVTAAIAAVLVSMAFSADQETRTSLYQSLGAWIVFLAIFGVRNLIARRGKAASTAHASHEPHGNESPEAVR